MTSISERNSRSIFVGNIPYDVTEEDLKSLFSQSGTVVGFRLVRDRDNGRPKGFGFCEFNSQDVAQNAIRTLKNISINGRLLRIGSATSDSHDSNTNSQNSSGFSDKFKHNQSSNNVTIEPISSHLMNNNANLMNVNLLNSNSNLMNHNPNMMGNNINLLGGNSSMMGNNAMYCNVPGFGMVHNQQQQIQALTANVTNPLMFFNPTGAASSHVGSVHEEAIMPPVTESPKSLFSMTDALATMSPEQMFQVMLQMKQLIESNPGEAREVLLKNPQMTYALLQAQAQMKIIDPQVAMAILNRTDDQIPASQYGNVVSPQAHHGGPQFDLRSVPLPSPPHHQQQHQQDFTGSSGSRGKNDVGKLPLPLPLQPQGNVKMEATLSTNNSPQPQQHPAVHSPPENNGGMMDEALIQQVMQLTDEQLCILPPEQREAIRMFRQHLNASRT